MEDNEVIWSDVIRNVVRYYIACLLIALTIYFFVVKAERAAEKRGIAKGRRAEFWESILTTRKHPVEPAKEESNG